MCARSGRQLGGNDSLPVNDRHDPIVMYRFVSCLTKRDEDFRFKLLACETQIDLLGSWKRSSYLSTRDESKITVKILNIRNRFESEAASFQLILLGLYGYIPRLIVAEYQSRTICTSIRVQT